MIQMRHGQITHSLIFSERFNSMCIGNIPDASECKMRKCGRGKQSITPVIPHCGLTEKKLSWLAEGEERENISASGFGSLAKIGWLSSVSRTDRMRL